MTKCDLISNAQLEKEQKELKEKFIFCILPTLNK